MAFVLSERRGRAAVLTLNNPRQLNAVTFPAIREIGAVLQATMADDGIGAVVLTGSGAGFCAGAQIDKEVFAPGGAVAEQMREALSPLIELMRSAPKPVVTAVNGAAAGVGVGIALAGDMAIAARSARFVLSFARLGAVLDGGTSLLVQRAIGAPRARALALLGEALPAETAAEWGLIWRCVDDIDLTTEAMAVANRLAEGPPKALAWIKAQCEAGSEFAIGAGAGPGSRTSGASLRNRRPARGRGGIRRKEEVELRRTMTLQRTLSEKTLLRRSASACL